MPDYEGMLETFYTGLLQAGDHCVDVGAHEGRHDVAVELCRRLDQQVIGVVVELVDAAVDRLEGVPRVPGARAARQQQRGRRASQQGPEARQGKRVQVRSFKGPDRDGPLYQAFAQAS